MTDTIIFGTIPSMQNLAGECALAISTDWSFQPALNSSDDSEGKRVKLICAYSDERTGRNRSITDIDWSPKVILRPVASV